jgi:hypothetical protein
MLLFVPNFYFETGMAFELTHVHLGETGYKKSSNLGNECHPYTQTERFHLIGIIH